VYAIDLLGQGQSWPTQVQCQQSGPLCYSADTWTEQLFHFIEEKVGEPVYIAGNSLGEMHWSLRPSLPPMPMPAG
jgi:pimeloyl-ACP methyl ester carboxylesterase